MNISHEADVNGKRYLVDVVKRLGHRQVLGGARSVLAAEEEAQTRCTGAVRDADSARELDEVADGDLRVRTDERRLRVDNVVDTSICVEVRLRVGKDNHATVRATAESLS